MRRKIHTTKKKNTVKKRQSLFVLRGDVGLIVLAAVAVFAFLLGGGIANFTQTNYGIQGNLVTPIPSYGTHQSQQLHTLTFTTITPAPTGISSCGHSVSGSHECDVLYAYSVESTGAGGAGLKIKLFYDDESAMPLGSGSVSPMNPSSPGPAHIVNPNVGNVSVVDANKYPYFPAIFLTDITGNPNNTSGDAQNGGTPIPPDEVYGAWTSKENVMDHGSGNGTNLGSGADSLPASNGPSCGEGHDLTWTAENIWHVSNLKLGGQPLISGHQYRVQFAMHDGDQSQGGDVGDGCVTVTAP